MFEFKNLRSFIHITVQASGSAFEGYHSIVIWTTFDFVESAEKRFFTNSLPTKQLWLEDNSLHDKLAIPSLREEHLLSWGDKIGLSDAH